MGRTDSARRVGSDADADVTVGSSRSEKVELAARPVAVALRLGYQLSLI